MGTISVAHKIKVVQSKWLNGGWQGGSVDSAFALAPEFIYSHVMSSLHLSGGYDRLSVKGAIFYSALSDGVIKTDQQRPAQCQELKE